MSEANKRQVGGDHYATEDGIQHWDLFGPDYLIGYATKYIRWRKKGGVEDLEKMIHVVEKLKEIVTEANMPKYDMALVLRWQVAVGLDFVERMVVNKIMFMRGHRDLDLAIDGIRYLIEQHGRVPSVREQLGRIHAAAGGRADTSVLPRNINYNKLDDHTSEELETEIKRLEAANAAAVGWGAAVGERVESIKMLRSSLAARLRRVPRYADGGYVRGPNDEDKSFVEMLTPDAGHPPDGVPAKLSSGEYSMDGGVTWTAGGLAESTAALQRRKDDAAQHASLFPWCMTKDQWQATFTGRMDLANAFYLVRGLSQKILDVVVVHEKLPRELATCYTRFSGAEGGFWVINIDRVPAELRDFYPSLRREVNSLERDQLPEWQRGLYRWSESENKWQLTERESGWAQP